MSASNPVVPSLPMQPGQGGGPGGFPIGQPGFLSPAPPQPTTVVNPELAPPDPEALALDPLALNRAVKITVNASERMRTRDNLRQTVPFIAQFAMSGPFLQELAQSNMSVDFIDFSRMIMDATGLQQDYRIFKDMTPEEQQKRSQPSPDAQLKSQQAQQDLQTRKDLMQMKVMGEQTVAQIQAMVKDKQITEESARHLMTIFQQEQADKASAPDPREKILDMQMKAQDHQQGMQQQTQKHQLSMAQLIQKHQLEMQKAHQTHQLDQAHQHQQVRTDAHAAQNKLVFDAMAQRQKLKHSEEAHKKKMSEPAPKPTKK